MSGVFDGIDTDFVNDLAWQLIKAEIVPLQEELSSSLNSDQRSKLIKIYSYYEQLILDLNLLHKRDDVFDMDSFDETRQKIFFKYNKEVIEPKYGFNLPISGITEYELDNEENDSSDYRERML